MELDKQVSPDFYLENCTLSTNTTCTNLTCAIENADKNCSILSNWFAQNTTDAVPFHPDPFLEEFQLNSRFWIQKVLVPIIMIIGVIGNTVTIFIMTQRRMRSSTNWYLAALAIFDMTYLVFSFALSLQHYPHIHDAQFYPYWKLWPYMLTITDSSSNCSVWITVTFTIERYIAVCHPIKGKVICTESRAKKMILIVFFVCFVITLPTCFEWIVVEVTNPVTNKTQIRVDYSDLGNNPVYVAVYYWTISVMFVFIPLLILAVFNAFLIKSVHSSKTTRKTMTRRKESGDQDRQESKITVMLIAVVILFLVCQLPTAITLLYKAFHEVPHGTNEDLLLRGLGNIFNFLVAVNAAGNFVLYCLLSQKYRRTFLLIFCPCLKGRIPALHSVYKNVAVYTTMDNESPSSSKKFSVRMPVNAAANKQAFTKLSNQRQSPSTRSTHLSFNKSVAVYSDGNGTFPTPGDSGSHRLLRGFRCPWKRPKIATGPNEEDRTGQFIPLKSPSKTPNFDSIASPSETALE